MKEIHYKLVWMTCFLLSINRSLAQSDPNSTQLSPNPTLQNIVPPSPNVGSLGKFGDIPVGYFTGIPKISIPIFSYSNSNSSLNLAISLDYHAGGVRVGEIGSNVGIGWALNCGGVVSRTLMGGFADEDPQSGFINEPALPSQNQPAEGEQDAFTSLYSIYSGHSADTQNDVFSFNCGGQTGKFLIGKNNDFLMLTKNNIKVVKEMGQVPGLPAGHGDVISKFTLTTDDGTQYVFEDAEVTHFGVNEYYTSSWYLSKIVAPFSTDVITFGYRSLAIPFYGTDVIQTEELRAGENTWGLNVYGSNVLTFPGQELPVSKELTTINFPDKTIVNFSYETVQRTDYPGDYLLKTISVSNGNNLRGYNLYHDYSTNRATLLKILPFDQNGNENKGYSCSYYPGLLPDRLSAQQDHWGYYNGNGSNGVYLPQEYFLDNSLNALYGIPSGYYEPLSGADREVNVSLSKIGTLNQLNYPTGGYTVFDLESNTSNDPKLIKSVPVSGSQVNNSSVYIHLNSAYNTYNDTFIFTGDANSITKFSLTFPQNTSTTQGSVTQVITDGNGQVLANNVLACGYGHQIINFTYNIAALIPGTTYNVVTTLTDLDNDSFSGYSAHLDITEDQSLNPVLTTIAHPYVGGLRVKSIKDYDGTNSVPTSDREFDYLLEDGITSSGTLGIYPVYSYSQYIEFFMAGPGVPDPSTVVDGNNGDEFNGNYITRSSYPLMALTSVQGCPVTYGRVVERLSNNGLSNGETIRYYTSFADYPAELSSIPRYSFLPYTPSPYHDWDYGLLKKELIYDNTGYLLRETDNNYQSSNDHNNSENFRSITLAPTKYVIPLWDIYSYHAFLGSDWTSIGSAFHFQMNSFFPVFGRSDLISSTVTDFRPSGNIVTTKLMTYDPNYFSLKVRDIFNSKEEIYEERYYYPYDYTVGGNLATLVSNNIFTPVISSETWKLNKSGNYLMSGVINQYNTFPSGIRKSVVQTFQSVTPVSALSVGDFDPTVINRSPSFFKDYIYLSGYTNQGFITSQSKVHAPTQSFIWDYNGQQPIAEVKNAAITDIAYTSFEADGSGNWTISSTARNNAGISGSQSYPLAGANTISKSGLSGGTTYVISYWVTGSALNIAGTITGYPLQGATVNGWTYYEHHITGQTDVSITGTGNLDELRLYPVNSQMTTYTYNPVIGLTSSINEKNQITYYEYDSLQRLMNIRDMNGNITKHTDYHYQGQ